MTQTTASGTPGAGDVETAASRSAESTRTTHGAPQAIDASRCYGALIAKAIQGASKEELVGDSAAIPVGDDLNPEVHEVVAGSYRHRQPPEIKGKGYVVPALEAALWALYSTRTFEEGVLAAVNLGDDADTTAAIYGQLAGALMGVDSIPARWRDQVVMADRITDLADGLLALSQTGLT